MALAQEIHKLAQVLVCMCMQACANVRSVWAHAQGKSQTVCVYAVRFWGVRIGVGDAACTEAVRKTAKGLSVCICIGVLVC